VIAVVAAVIERDGHFLITRRQDGVHLAGLWEFPGGKIHDGESHAAALRRELLEELDTDAEVGALLLETTHDYGEKVVRLFFYACTLTGTPRPLLGQDMQWVPRADLPRRGFPAADAELITLLTTSAAR
jgi:mutator protein MutT